MLSKATRAASQSVLKHNRSTTALSKINLQGLKMSQASLGSISHREFASAKDMSELQMNNRMFITQKVLQKQVDIMKNDKIPENLKQSDQFVYRHIGNSENSTRRMLDFLKYNTVEEFIDDVVPEQIRLTKDQYFSHNGRTLDGIDSELLMLERIR